MDIFTSAKQFALATEILAVQNDTNLHPPSVVCASLTIELLIKCILCKRGIKHRKVHKHSQLFELLAYEDQSTVLKEFNNIANKNLTIDEFKILLKETADNSFIEWRYLHEKTLSARSNLRIDQKTLADITNAFGKTAALIMDQEINIL